jgi:hypothetical protein
MMSGKKMTVRQIGRTRIHESGKPSKLVLLQTDQDGDVVRNRRDLAVSRRLFGATLNLFHPAEDAMLLNVVVGIVFAAKFPKLLRKPPAMVNSSRAGFIHSLHALLSS